MWEERRKSKGRRSRPPTEVGVVVLMSGTLVLVVACAVVVVIYWFSNFCFFFASTAIIFQNALTIFVMYMYLSRYRGCTRALSVDLGTTMQPGSTQMLPIRRNPWWCKTICGDVLVLESRSEFFHKLTMWGIFSSKSQRKSFQQGR